MFNFVCGALGLLGGFIFGIFLFSEADFGYREGRTQNTRLPHPLYGCIIAVSGPMIAAALIPMVGLRWCLLGPAVALVVLYSIRSIARFLGSTRSVSLHHARASDILLRRAGVAKLVLRTDPAKDPEARQALEEALASGDREILSDAAAALVRAGLHGVVAEALAKPFLDPERAPKEAHGIGQVLQGLGVEAAGPLLKLLETSSTPPICRAAIIHALGKLRDERVLRVVVGVLEDPDPYLRVAAIQWLGEQDAAGSRERLLASLRDPSPIVRATGVRGLGTHRDRSAADEILPLAADPNASVRRVVIEVLGEFEDPRVAGAAIQALSEPELECRRQGIIALGKLRAPGAVEPLVAALQDPAAELHPYAALALGRIGDRRAVEGLSRTLRTDTHYYSRVRAAEALESMGWKAESPPDQSALALARGSWDHAFEPDEQILSGFQAALMDGDAAVGAVPRLARLLLEKPAGISDAWLWAFSQLDDVAGPEQDRRGPETLDCEPIRKAARVEIARRATATR